MQAPIKRTAICSLFALALVALGSSSLHACSCWPVIASPCEVIEYIQSDAGRGSISVVEVTARRDAPEEYGVEFTVQLVELISGHLPFESFRILSVSGSLCGQYIDAQVGDRLLSIAGDHFSQFPQIPSYCSQFGTVHTLDGTTFSYETPTSSEDIKIDLQDLRDCASDAGIATPLDLPAPMLAQVGESLFILDEAQVRYGRSVYTLYDVTGAQLLTTVQQELSLASLPVGYYIVQVRRREQAFNVPFVRR